MTAGRRGRLARLEAQRPMQTTGTDAPTLNLAELSLSELRALHHDIAYDPTPRPELDTLTGPEATALYWQTIEGAG